MPTRIREQTLDYISGSLVLIDPVLGEESLRIFVYTERGFVLHGYV
jgi:hypothetical protein